MSLWYWLGAVLGVGSLIGAGYDASYGRWGAAAGGAAVGVWVLYLVFTRNNFGDKE